MSKICDAYNCGMLAWGTRNNPSTERTLHLCHSHMLTALNGHTFRVKPEQQTWKINPYWEAVSEEELNK